MIDLKFKILMDLKNIITFFHVQILRSSIIFLVSSKFDIDWNLNMMYLNSIFRQFRFCRFVLVGHFLSSWSFMYGIISMVVFVQFSSYEPQVNRSRSRLLGQFFNRYVVVLCACVQVCDVPIDSTVVIRIQRK